MLTPSVHAFCTHFPSAIYPGCDAILKRFVKTTLGTVKEVGTWLLVRVLFALSCCKTSNVVYVIQRKKCGKQCVGETEQPLNERMNNHHADVRHNRTEKPVALHFNSPGHTLDDIQVMVIERLWKSDTVFRKIRESRWISTLDTTWPKGMNLRIDSL